MEEWRVEKISQKLRFLNLFTEKCRERLLRVVWRWQQQQIKGTQYNERNHPSKAKRCSTATFCYSTLFIIAIARILYCTRVASKFSSKGKGRKCKQTFTRFFNSIWISRVKVKPLWFLVVVNYGVLCSPLSESIWYFRGLGRSDMFLFCKHSMIDFAGEMAGNCFPPCRSGSNWWIKPKELPKTMPPWQISTARTSHKGAITSLRTCSACTKRWESSHRVVLLIGY